MPAVAREVTLKSTCARTYEHQQLIVYCSTVVLMIKPASNVRASTVTAYIRTFWVTVYIATQFARGCD